MRFKRRRSSPRLASFDYVGPHAYHLILTTHNRLPRFRDARLVADCLDDLTASTKRYAFQVLAYCFMPNHLHLLMTGDDGAPLTRFVQHFKQATGHRQPGLWQRSSYDHVLRYEEAVEDVAHYIWGNPVRAGLAEDAVEYAFSGPREILLAEAGRHPHAEDRAEALSLRSGAPQAVETPKEARAWKP